MKVITIVLHGENEDQLIVNGNVKENEFNTIIVNIARQIIEKDVEEAGETTEEE